MLCTVAALPGSLRSKEEGVRSAECGWAGLRIVPCANGDTADGEAIMIPRSIWSSVSFARCGSVHGTVPTMVSVPASKRHGLYNATCACSGVR